MTWTRLGDEFAVEACDLSDAEYRTHTEALIWSNWRLLDLRSPKCDLPRFTESPDAQLAADGLVAKGWWQDSGESWFVGMRFPDWQRDRDQVEHRRAYLAAAQQRSRKHKDGDHSECLPQSHCRRLSTVDNTVDPGRVGTARDGSTKENHVQREESSNGQQQSRAERRTEVNGEQTCLGCEQPPRRSCSTCWDHAYLEAAS